MCSVPRKSRFTGLGWDFCRMGGLTIDMTAAWWGLSVGGRLGWSRDASAMGLA